MKKPGKGPSGRSRAPAGQVSPRSRTRIEPGKGGRKPTSSRRGLLPMPRPKAPPKPTVTRPAPRPKVPPRPVITSLSLDRKLDILGIGLAFVGLLTLLGMLSSTQSSGSMRWIGALAQAFGWGMYLFPLVLLGVGLWLVLRNFERVPQVSVERIFGLSLMYTALLIGLHVMTGPAGRPESYALAAKGQGGGYLGAFLLEFLRGALGLGGAVIAILAWVLIALALTLDVSIPDLFRWAPPLMARLRAAWEERRALRGSAPGGTLAPRGYQPPPPERGVPGISTSAVPASSAAGGTATPFTPQPSGLTPARSIVQEWVLPPVEQILEAGSDVQIDDEIDRQRAHIIEETLASFGAPVNVVEINRGPTITQFGVEPDFIETRSGRMRVRVGKIAALADDLALALSARTIRIQAPVPGKGYVGIEVPNDEIALVALRDVIDSDAFRRLKSPLRFALGQNVAGEAVAADLAVMPHLLVAGATGSGKSVCVNSLISSLLLFNTPDDLRLIMVDPKRVELTNYNGIPHLLAPVVVEMERVVGALQWVMREMDNRYHKLAQAGCRNITEYNSKISPHGERKLAHLVVFIDELADLMMLAPDETERSITRLAQLARATGIHLVIATQRPSVDVVTGLIKANFPARIAFAVASGVDSRVILDQPGAERLLGRGDMLFQAPDAPAPVRLQGSFVSDLEIQHLVSFWQAQAGTVPLPAAPDGAVDAVPSGVPLKQMPLWEEMQAEANADPLLNEAIDLSRRQGRASISMLQRRLRIGYTRAARLIESMEEKGIIGPADSASGSREVLDYGPAGPPVEEQ
jgi:S-DNA-T family DNA segregation ATPase FtsK/SpoIIIE